MKDLNVVMATMSERIDKLTEENQALWKQTPLPATQPLLASPSTLPSVPKRKSTGPLTPPGEATEGHLPNAESHADRQRITQLVRACIRTGYHPKI